MTAPTSNSWRVWRLSLANFGIALTLVGLFYTEENWRGQAAWDSCKRRLEAQGVDLNWADYIPADVPEDQNVFGVPQMQKWFTDRGETELSKKMHYPGRGMYGYTEDPNTPAPRLVLADLKINLPEKPSAGGSNVLRWDNPLAQDKVTKLLEQALGPVAMHPGSSNLLFTGRPLDEIQPAQITLKCQRAPSANELLQFLPKVSVFTHTQDDDPLELEPGEGGYTVSMSAPDTAAKFLNWTGQFAPEFALIRDALQRPVVQIQANYRSPATVGIPNFATTRVFVQTHAVMAECHLLERDPDAAQADLTQIFNLCHIFTNRPITLVAAMINSAVVGLYANTIADGLRLSGWRDAQLAALEEQLQSINVVAPVYESFRMEPVADCQNLQTMPTDQLMELLFPDAHAFEKWGARLFPRGWIYQNMATIAPRLIETDKWMDPTNQIIRPQQIDASQKAISSLSAKSPYSFLVAKFIPNTVRACQSTALNQTKAHQALIACALERYRQAHGEYPESLGALTPQFLNAIPNDVIGGEPPRYRRDAEGSFLLYSIGWSGRDLGGARGKSAAEGDWVWPEGY